MKKKVQEFFFIQTLKILREWNYLPSNMNIYIYKNKIFVCSVIRCWVVYLLKKIYYNLRIIYCFNLLMIIPTLQKNTITEIIYLTLMC